MGNPCAEGQEIADGDYATAMTLHVADAGGAECDAVNTYGTNAQVPLSSAGDGKACFKLFGNGKDGDAISSVDVATAFLQAKEYGPEEEPRYVKYKPHKEAAMQSTYKFKRLVGLIRGHGHESERGRAFVARVDREYYE